MNAMSPSEFAERVLEMAGPDAEFKPTATYDPDGDCIEFLISDDDFYAERLDGLVTVYYSRETNEIVGSLIKGVSAFCKRILKHCPGFAIEVRDGPVYLSLLFRAQLWTESYADTIKVKTYRKLIEVAEQSGVETTMPGLT